MRGAQEGASCGISMRQTGDDRPRPCGPRRLLPPSSPHRPAPPRPVGSLLHSSTTAVGLPAPGALAPDAPPPRWLRACGRSHQLPLLLLPPACCRAWRSCHPLRLLLLSSAPAPPFSSGSVRALKLAMRLGRPTDAMPWSRASLGGGVGSSRQGSWVVAAGTVGNPACAQTTTAAHDLTGKAEPGRKRALLLPPCSISMWPPSINKQPAKVRTCRSHTRAPPRRTRLGSSRLGRPAQRTRQMGPPANLRLRRKWFGEGFSATILAGLPQVALP